MNKNIRSKVVKKSLLDYTSLANTLRENTESAVKNLLDEAVRDTYAKLLSEDDDKDYEEEEVEDTASDTTDDAESVDAATDGVEDTDTSMETDAELDDADGDKDEESSEEDVDDTLEVDDESGDDLGEDGEDLGDDSDEWAEFDKYKVSDDEYDFSNAEDEEIVKVYKLMKNDDQILVHKDDNGNVNIQDNETGAEYLISLGGEDNEISMDDDFGAEDDEVNNFDEDMNESTEKMYELVLEYDSNVGYTDNYQKKDVMTNPGMSEPGKNVNDWDAGVPKGDSKPWSGYPSKKNKADKPFNSGKGKQVEEEHDIEIQEGTGKRQGRDAHGMGKTHLPTNDEESFSKVSHVVSRGGEYEGSLEPKNESFTRRADKALHENKELKSTLKNVIKSLKEAAVTNHNLGMIIKLISENSTTQDEKKEIISRFSNEAKTVDASKTLYESISRDLQKSRKMNITENSNLTVEGSKKINETKIYQSQDMLESLDLMHRMMK